MLLLLVMHLMVHPMTHGLAALSSVNQPHSVSAPLNVDLGSSSSAENCDLCRVGQSVTTSLALTRIQLLNPQGSLVRISSSCAEPPRPRPSKYLIQSPAEERSVRSLLRVPHG